MSKIVSIIFLAILLAGGFFRFYLLSEIPPGLYPDEAMNGSNALQTIHTGEFKLFYQENNGREGLLINIQALAVKLFGTNVWSLRVVSALFGTLTILGIYLLTKELFEKRKNLESGIRNLENDFQNSKFKIPNSTTTALLASFFLATSYWHINFSRIGFRAIMLPFLLSFGLYWLLRGLRTGNIWSLALGGLCIGAGFHSYIAFRFVPFIIAMPIVWYVVRWYQGNKDNQQQITNNQPLHHCVPCAITLFLFVTFVVALPMGIYFLKHPEDFFGRSKEVSIFSSPNPIFAVAVSTGKTIQMFNIIGDCNARHNYRCQPELFLPVGILFLIGAWLTLKHLLRKGSLSDPNSFPLLVIVTMFFVMLFPVVLTKEGLPHALRAIGMILPAMIIAAWGGVWLYDTVQHYCTDAIANPRYVRYQNQLRRIKKEMTVLAFALLVFIAASAYQTYFVKFRTAPETNKAFRTDLTDVANYIVSLPRTTDVYVLANYSNLSYGLPIETEVIKYRTDTVRKEEQDQKHIHYVLPNELDAAIHSLPLTQKTVFIPLNQDNRMIFPVLKKSLPQFSFKVANNFIVLQN